MWRSPFHARLFRLLPGAILATPLASGCTAVSASSSAGGSDGGMAYDAHVDAGGGGPSSDAAACAPGDVATFQPTFHPANQVSGACSAAQVETLFAACFGPSRSDVACHDFRADPANDACTHCVITPDSAPSYGPVIDHQAFVTANVPGCIQLAIGLAGATSAGGAELACAKDVQARESCQLVACAANCDVHDAASLAAFEDCARQAAGGGCGPYATAAVCLDSLADASAGLAQCLLPDFGAFYAAVVPFFCVGAPAVDAGVAPPLGDAGAATD